MSRPRGAVGDYQLPVLLALVRVHARDGRATLRAVAAEAGLSSTSTVLVHLRRLERAGLVTWDEGAKGTLRPLVAPVVVAWDEADERPVDVPNSALG